VFGKINVPLNNTYREIYLIPGTSLNSSNGQRLEIGLIEAEFVNVRNNNNITAILRPRSMSVLFCYLHNFRTRSSTLNPTNWLRYNGLTGNHPKLPLNCRVRSNQSVFFIRIYTVNDRCIGYIDRLYRSATNNFALPTLCRNSFKRQFV